MSLAAEHPADADASRVLFACLRAGDAAGERLVALARDFSPRTMRVAAGEVVIDVGGLGRLIGDADTIARELRRAIADAGLNAAVALAPTVTAARLLARARGASALAAIDIDVLRDVEVLPPAMPVRDRERPYETLRRWGIGTLGAFAALPAGELSSRLGRRGVALQRLARGVDPRPFVPDADAPRFVQRLELEWPIDGLEPLSFVFARLLDPLAIALERADRGAAAIRLDLRLADRSTHARVLQLPAPIRDPRVLRTLLLLDLESHPPPAAIDIVAIEVDPAPSRITQFSLIERAVPSPETLATLTARLAALVGESRIGCAALVDTHQPGAFEMLPFAIAERRPAVGQEPDGRVLVLRRQRTPPAIRVNVDRGRPVYIPPSRRGIPSGAITQAAGPWRHSGGWWLDARADPPAAPKPRTEPASPTRRSRAPRLGSGRPEHVSKDEGGWDRSEWDVAVTTGAVCRIFQDRVTGVWFLEGIYD